MHFLFWLVLLTTVGYGITRKKWTYVMIVGLVLLVKMAAFREAGASVPTKETTHVDADYKTEARRSEKQLPPTSSAPLGVLPQKGKPGTPKPSTAPKPAIGVFVFEGTDASGDLSKLKSLAHQEGIEVLSRGTGNGGSDAEFAGLNGAMVWGLGSRPLLAKMQGFVEKGGRVIAFYEFQNRANNTLLGQLLHLAIIKEQVAEKDSLFFPDGILPPWLKGIKMGFDADTHCRIGCYLECQEAFWQGSITSEETGQDRTLSAELRIGKGSLLLLPELSDGGTLYDDHRLDRFENKEALRRILTWLAGRQKEPALAMGPPSNKIQPKAIPATVLPARSPLILDIPKVCEDYRLKSWNSFREAYPTLTDDWYLLSGRLELLDLGEFEIYGITNEGSCLVLGQDRNMEHRFPELRANVGKDVIVGTRGFSRAEFMNSFLLRKMEDNGSPVHGNQILNTYRIAVYGLAPSEIDCTLADYQKFKIKVDESSLMNSSRSAGPSKR